VAKGRARAELQVQVGDSWALMDLQVVCGTMGMPTATVKLRGPEGMPRVASAIGEGPVDAAYKAVDAIVHVPAVLLDYSVNSVTAGIEALATTRVRSHHEGLHPAQPAIDITEWLYPATCRSRQCRAAMRLHAAASLVDVPHRSRASAVAMAAPRRILRCASHADAHVQVQIKPSGKIGAEGYVTTASEVTFARTFSGQGADGDIVVASTRAYVSALNKMISHLVANAAKADGAADSAAAEAEAGEASAEAALTA
jgi:hypothetical protein